MTRRPAATRTGAARAGAVVPALLTLSMAVAVPGAARAQAFGELLDSEIPLSTRTKNSPGVLDRYRPELAAQGLPAGGFRLYPEVTGGIGYTSNVIGAEQDTRSDFFAELRPQVTAQSDWSRHSLSAVVNYDGRRYADTPQKNQDGYLAQINGRLDVVGESDLNVQLQQRRTYEDQAAGSFPANGGGAIGVNQSTALLRGSYLFNRLRLTGSADANRLTYSDTTTTTGARLSQSFRDRSVFRTSARLEYLLNADDGVYGQITYRGTRYDDRTPINDHSGSEWRFVGGAIGNVTSLIRVAMGVGYFHRDFDQSLFRSVGGIVADARADYYVTTLTTVSLIASRKLEEVTLAGASGYTSTRFGGRIDHELYRNLRLALDGGVQGDDFIGVDRNDRLYVFGLGAEYIPDRQFVFQPRAEYVDRSSRGNAAGPSIKEFRALLSVTARR